MKITRSETIPGIVFYHLTRDGSQPGRPWPMRNHSPTFGGGADEAYLTERGLLKIFGLWIAWSSYSEATAAASGAPVGILRSWWIYTRRRAYGRGLIVDLAKLQALEIQVSGHPPIVTENGTFEFRPPITDTAARGLAMKIRNRNPCEARGYFTFVGLRPLATPLTASAAYVAVAGSSGTMRFSVLANGERTLQPVVSPLTTIQRIVYGMEPGFTKRRARIYGRPEWLA